MKAIGSLLLVLATLLATPAIAREAPPDHSFTASEADPGGSYSPDRENVAAADPGSPGNGQLLVFLSGTGAKPRMYNRVLRSAVEDGGFHSIGLDWPNGFDTSGDEGSNVFGPCGSDAACFGEARREAFDGQDHTPKVTIGPTDSILNRLSKALSYLDKTYPNEGWGGFLAGGQPVWSRIVLAGHSNGSGEAAFIATQVEVARVALFSGPVDSTGSDPNFVAAPWVTAHPATPASRWYGFADKFDNKGKLARVDREHATWTALGMETSGGPAMVDGMSPPYGGAHALMTDLMPCDGCTPHNMVAADKTPMDGTNAVFRPVWDYMLGSTGGSASAATENQPAAVAADDTASAAAGSDSDADAASDDATAPDTTAAVTATTANQQSPAAATANGIATPGDGLPAPQIISYQSDGLSLKGYLYVPPGTGPFPVYLWNHGSEQQPNLDRPLAKYWMGQGFIFFKPIRSGHGGNPGDYIGDGEKALFTQLKAGSITLKVRNDGVLALHRRANEDVVNAYKWLLTQPEIDKTKIVVGGGSYGGIQTLLTAEANATQKLGIAAFVAMSPAAESWRPAWAQDLKGVIRGAAGPIFLLQAHNDFNLGPTEVLGSLIDARGGASRCRIYPDHLGGVVLKSTDPRMQGHAGFFEDPTAWSGGVSSFLAAAQVTAAAPAGAIDTGSPCSASE